MVTESRSASTTQRWRLDPVHNSRLAWLCLIPHVVAWAEPANATIAAGYSRTEERQNLIEARETIEALKAELRRWSGRDGEVDRPLDTLGV